VTPTDAGARLPSLAEAHQVPDECIAELAATGHTVVRGLASREEVAAFRPAIERAVARHAERAAPLDERDTYGKAFLQVPNLWQRDPVIERFVHAPRFAQVAAALLGVEGVRLYHDQALCKEPGGGFTPWHQDQVYWPFETDRTITMWMPLVDVPADVGSMTFASGSHRLGELGRHVIGDDSESAYTATVEALGLPLDTHGAVAAGDATFHLGWTLHRAPANTSDQMRSVMTVIYFADGAVVGPLDSPYRAFDNKVWLDSIPTGEPAAGPLNPVLWPVPS
jgi:ectoine hydroxylase-related dioxygenase (phytanoyl-CoA dioxygenase family)